MYSGVIEGIGPRYCPSIEDKIHRFADKESHQVFIEPEGLTTHELYPNGISTSLPFDVQLQIVRSIRGMENAHIVRPGYAIEYDYFDPRDLKYSTETKVIGGLFLQVRSMAPRGTKRRALKVCWPEPTRPFVHKAETAGARVAMRPTSAYWSMT